MKAPLLCLEGVEKTYHGPGGRRRKVLDGISFELHAGEAMGLLGPSGTGKSTLARIIQGLEPPDRGNVRLKGKLVHLNTSRKKQAHFRSVQMVWQDPSVYLNPYQSILETIMEPLTAFRICPAGERIKQAKALMALMALPFDLAKRRPHQLSGGQCQRVALARALAAAPDILICDEALVSLDLPQQAAMLQLLRRLKSETGLSLLFISHNLDTVRIVCDHIRHLENGRLTVMTYG